MLLKKLLIRTLEAMPRGIWVILAIAYPFAIFFGLKHGITLRTLALVLLAYIVISFSRHKNRILLLLGLILCSMLLCFNQSIFLKIYPVLMNGAVCLLFITPPCTVPLITKLALRKHCPMDRRTYKYTCHANMAWGIFMAINTIVSLLTVFASDQIWILYNGLISYLLIGAMMITEYIIRQRVQRNEIH